MNELTTNSFSYAKIEEIMGYFLALTPNSLIKTKVDIVEA